MSGALPAPAIRAAEQALPAFLRAQRWFGAKSRAAFEARLGEAVPLPGAPAAIAIARISFEDGSAERYALVLGLDGASIALDAADDPRAARSLLHLVATGGTLERAGVRIRGERAHRFPPADVPLEPVRRLAGEQSNTSLIFGQALVLKLFRKLEPGLNPEVEIGRHLTDRVGFAHGPRFFGAVSIEDETGGATLAVAQELVREGTDAWRETLAAVGRALDAGALAAGTGDAGAAAAAEVVRARVRELGRATGEMHRALAAAADDPAFAPEPVTVADLGSWRASVEARLARVDRTIGPAAPERRGLREAVESSFAALEHAGPLGRKVRQHGDYHLGQVLFTPRGVAILDFEGEPARPIAERRQKATPLRDVAGMLRSYDYAAHAALFDRAAPGSPEWDRLEPAALAFEAAARAAFLAGHAEALAPSGVLPPAEADRALLLGIFELEKAVYEVGYELDHRPGWVRIPLRGIERLLARRALHGRA